MREKIEKIHQQAKADLGEVTSESDIQNLRNKYLGRKAELTRLLRDVKQLPPEERPQMGQLANRLRSEIEEALAGKKFDQSGLVGNIDITLPGKRLPVGHYHPLTRFLRKVKKVFSSMGFEIVDGPEVETAENNFDLLNIPKDHPARDMWDTFYVNRGKGINRGKSTGSQLLLRTHTSPGQIRAMANRKPPVRIIVPGRVFRHEATDASHEAQFCQCEGLVIDKDVAVTDLIGTLKAFLNEMFGEDVKIRIRPEFYPFVEPGMDIDMSCILCSGKGCSVCSQRGWLEMLGSGMVHPTVLKNMKVDPKQYSGFAFGLGIDRLMMLYYGVQDVRLSYSNDLRFLKQF